MEDKKTIQKREEYEEVKVEEVFTCAEDIITTSGNEGIIDWNEETH